MKILLRVSEFDERVHSTILALDPESGSPLTRIPAISRTIWCDNDSLSTEYDHPEGIYWNSWTEAEAQLIEHEIVRD